MTVAQYIYETPDGKWAATVRLSTGAIVTLPERATEQEAKVKATEYIARFDPSLQGDKKWR